MVIKMENIWKVVSDLGEFNHPIKLAKYMEDNKIDNIDTIKIYYKENLIVKDSECHLLDLWSWINSMWLKGEI